LSAIIEMNSSLVMRAVVVISRRTRKRRAGINKQTAAHKRIILSGSSICDAIVSTSMKIAPVAGRKKRVPPVRCESETSNFIANATKKHTPALDMIVTV